jgi:hypothetical protein
MKHEEDTLQANIVYAVRLYYPHSLIYAIPNGGKRNVIEAARFKRQGVTAGVSDLHLIHNGKIYFIEVKTSGGRQSLLQEQFEKFVKSQGFEYYIVRSVDDVLTLISKL